VADQPLAYVSTRGRAPELAFTDVLLRGLADDGGLYVPSAWPVQDLTGLAPDAGYLDVAQRVIWPYLAGTIYPDDFDEILAGAYATFRDPDVVPLRDLGDGLWLAELFWGPTLAFKDIALQLVGRLFDHELTRRSERATIVVATSGDTGSAAIEACVGRDTLDIVVLHPAGRVSDVQRRQMTTVDAPNVHNVAIEGTFDDCQDLVKACFADVAFREQVRLSAMNSINWARVMAQVVYYATTVAKLGRCSFTVPTGNFGNVFSGWIAERMGVPIDQLVIGSNSNDILTRWVRTGSLVAQDVVPTYSPSMDIQVSSNHERLLFELSGRDGQRTAELVQRFRGLGSVEVPRDPRFDAASVDDAATLEVIRDLHARTGVLVDPHTAVGIGAARATWRDRQVPMVCLATAHPAKFPDAVERATGLRPALPARLADLLERTERYDVLPADLAQVQAHVAAAVAHR
jgi:threonine synthase